MNRFEDKVVIVTGAGTGIGAATARRILNEGAFVTLNGRREIKLQETIAGVIATNLGRHLSPVLRVVFRVLTYTPLLKSIPQGAATTCYVAARLLSQR